VLAEAARLPVPPEGLDLRPPPAGRGPTAGRGILRRIGPAWWRAAAAAVVVLAAGPFAHRGWLRHAALRDHPRVSVTGPATVMPGGRLEYLAEGRRLDGAPIDAEVEAMAVGGAGRVLAKTRMPLDRDGRAHLVLAPEAFPAGETVRTTFRWFAPGGEARGVQQLVARDARPLAARVSTDRPMARPGEPLRARVVVLERFGLAPAATEGVRLVLEDPKGAVVEERTVPTAAGAGAEEFHLADDAPGGEYRLVASHPAGAFPPAECRVVVRAFRVPRLRTDIELDRDSYAPGAAGTALVSVARVEGGVPDGATVEAALVVDGKPGESRTLPLPASGALSVPFRLPASVAKGRANLSLVVRDGGTVEGASKTVRVTMDRLDVECFPEGGSLVAGLPGRVYFRARTPDGEPADLDAEVVDDAGAVVARARVEALGMGRFDLLPVAGRGYTLRAAGGKGPALSVDLPAPEAAGATLRALDDAASARGAVRVEVASTTPGAHRLEAWCRGVLLAQGAVDLVAGKPRRVDLAASAEAGGVVRVTLLDPRGVPVAERLVARDPARRLQIAVRASAEKVSPGDEVTITVAASDAAGRPAHAVLGASVVDEGLLALADDRRTPSLPQHFLLGMEVDDLEDATVLASSEKGRRAVDLLLGVQGWRRFAWSRPEEFRRVEGERGGCCSSTRGPSRRARCR
jgi:hypothetical protein